MARVCPGTPFRTRWLNETFYLLSCLMNMKEGTYMRWSHTRHHTETIMVGMDPEIQVMRPANLSRVLLDFLWFWGNCTRIDPPICDRLPSVSGEPIGEQTG